ncbi:hypothetical protein [Paenibacillus sp.]|uniref:hypothetical protein n=1 Tax=Paenibacillus sp. TaxID=58172 RepID=UPI002D34E517|nr:hypothetical protein [Paenibacillus sp.]HZG55635.1 hypothetical protein [Paenibacillus sp.]
MAYTGFNGCPAQGPIAAPTQTIVENVYHPMPVQVVHPIQIVKRHHCVPVYQHVTTVTVVDEAAANVCGVGRKPKKGRARARARR